MDKEKQIEEMVEIMCDDFGASFFAEKLYDAGYRKQSDTVKEFAASVKLAFYYEFDELIPSIMADKIDALVEEECGKEKRK